MGVGALGRNSGRSAEDGNEIGRVETELYPRIGHHSESLTCHCLPLHRRVKPDVPNPAGSRRVTDVQAVDTSHQARKLKRLQCCGCRVVIDLTKQVELLVD